MVPGKEGGVTVHYPDGVEMPIFDAAMQYGHDSVPLVVIGGKDYGMGSSRDWAAKGTTLLGVKAVIAESFERTHRSNLVGMGVMPLQFRSGENAQTLGLTGKETISIEQLSEDFVPGQNITVNAVRPDGTQFTFEVTVRLDNRVDVAYYLNGGILPTVLRNLLG
jgi:aconitate hydratase